VGAGRGQRWRFETADLENVLAANIRFPICPFKVNLRHIQGGQEAGFLAIALCRISPFFFF
jgi:hypothetical protein